MSYATGEILKKLRKERGMSQKAIADALGVNRTTYVKWENGDSNPNHRLEDLAQFFNVSADYLLGRADATAANSVPDSDDTDIQLIKKITRLAVYGSPDDQQIVLDYLLLSPEDKDFIKRIMQSIKKNASN